MISKLRHIFIIALIMAAAILTAPAATAHVTVQPKEIGVGKTTKFTVDVPAELEDKSTISLRLVLPHTMTIGRYIKPGWNMELKNEPGNPENMTNEITWSGGNIPSKFREEFEFFAQAPPKETTLIWKAYQTYSDGTVTAWVLNPKAEQPKNEEGKPDFSKVGPYSETKVINDLQEQPAVVKAATDDKKAQNALFLGIIAVALSTLSLGIHIYKK